MSQQISEIGKLPPQAVDIEEAVLGAIITVPRAIDAVISMLSPDCFYRPVHADIYRSISELYKKNEPIDCLTVTEQLRANNKLDDVGGPYYIALISSRIVSDAHLPYHAAILKQKYLSREVIRTASELMAKAYQDDIDVEDVLQFAESGVHDLLQKAYHEGNLIHVSAILEDVEKAFEKRIDATQNGLPTGITTGLFELNKLLGGGWQSSTLNVIAARPGMGKTAFLLHLAKAAARTGVPVCIYSLEMSDISLVNRLILAEAYVDERNQIKADRFRLGYCNEREWDLFQSAKARLASLPIYIDDNPIVDTLYIRTHSKMMKRTNRCGMILIDYLQLADMSDGNKTRNREQEVSQTTRQFKICAKEIEVPVILLSQLNRGVEGRNDKKPLLSDLRESGAIEQDADTVGFLYRPAYYKIETTHDGKDAENLGYFILAKQRDGASNEEIPFTHNESMTKIWDYFIESEPCLLDAPPVNDTFETPF